MRKYVSKVNKLLQAFSRLCFHVKSGIYTDSQIKDRQKAGIKETKEQQQAKGSNQSAVVYMAAKQYLPSQRLQLWQTLGCRGWKISDNPVKNLLLPSF